MSSTSVQKTYAAIAGVSPVGRSGADLMRDAELVQAGLAETSSEGGARLAQLAALGLDSNEIVVKSVTPNTGSSAGGVPITIKGKGFTGAYFVRFVAANGSLSNTVGSYVVVDDTTITCVSPSTSAAIMDILVVKPDSAGLGFNLYTAT